MEEAKLSPPEKPSGQPNKRRGISPSSPHPYLFLSSTSKQKVSFNRSVIINGLLPSTSFWTALKVRWAVVIP
jgi:hypothetical protein